MTCQGKQYGFTLVEVAIVLLIVGLLTRTLLTPLIVAQQHKQYELTRTELLQVKDSLLAHLVARGYLPCPIGSLSSSASADDPGRLECLFQEGGVPAVALGLSGAIDSHGALLDEWNKPYRYALSLNNHSSLGDQRLPEWTSPGEASNVGLRHLSSNLVLCIKPSPARCANRDARANDIAFVVLSLGKDDSTNGAQLENQDGDETFVVNALTVNSESPFDDQMVWSSTQDVIYWMLRSAWLP